MSKFIYFTDSHFDDKKPRFRSDESYLETCISKFKQVVAKAREYNCPIICGGDLFNSPSPRDEVVNSILDVLNGIEFYTLAGNHGCIGRNTSNASTICRLGTVSRISTFHLVNNKTLLNIGNTLVGFVDYCIPLKKKQFLFDKTPDIIITHNYWIPKFIDDKSSESRNITDIPTLKTKLVLLGHYHQPFKALNKGTVYYNPGSLLRQDCSRENTERIPKFILVDNCVIKEFELICQKIPFFVADKEDKDEWDMQVKRFISTMNSMKIELGMSLQDRIKLLLSKKANNSLLPDNIKSIISQDVVEELVKRLENSGDKRTKVS